jgi:hypothetical protein
MHMNQREVGPRMRHKFSCNIVVWESIEISICTYLLGDLTSPHLVLIRFDNTWYSGAEKR